MSARRDGSVPASALPALLEAVPGPCWIADDGGRVLAMNARGHERLADRIEAIHSAIVRRDVPEIELFAFEGGLVVVERSRADVRAAAIRYGLTPAQTRVLELLTDGLSNAAIASRLGVARRTVETHVTAILGKGGAKSRADLIRRVLVDR